MRHKRLFLVIGAVLLALLIVSVGLGLVFYRMFKPMFGYRPPPTPPELKQARIVTGDAFLVRSQFLNTNQSPFSDLNQPEVGSIDDIAVGEFDPHPGIDVIVAGRDGAGVVGRDGKKQATVGYDFQVEQRKLGPFNSPDPRSIIGELQIIDIEGDGISEYCSRGSIDGAVVFDHQGKRLWAIAKTKDYALSVKDLTIGDLNGDGVAEFVASRNGIVAFDRTGKTLWHQPMQFSPSQLAVVDVDADGKNEIITVGGEVTVRDSTGKELRSVQLPLVYASTFFLCPRPGKKVPNLLLVDEGYVWLLDFAGKADAKFIAPLSEFNDSHETYDGGPPTTTSVYKAKGAWVKLVKGQPEYFAVVTEFAALDRSVLYVYTAAGDLVYQEILPEESTSIAVLPSEKPDEAEQLLVGGSETIWLYGAK